MSGDAVPLDDFMRRDQEDDDDELYTIRQPSRNVPSTALEEALSAAVLRCAKEKFDGRPREENPLPEPLAYEEEDEEDELSEAEFESQSENRASRRSQSRSRSRAKSFKRESEAPDRGEKHGQMDTDSDHSSTESESTPRLRDRMLEPTVATDDQLSYDIMRPSIRSILAKLDATLMVLHHSRDAAVNYLSESSSESESEPIVRERRSRSRTSEPPAKKRRGRPPKAGLTLRLRTPPRPAGGSESAGNSPSKGPEQGSEADLDAPQLKKKGGRPRKVYPRLEGETDREWAVRVARLRKEPIPLFGDIHDSDDPKSSASEAQPNRSRTMKRTPSGSQGPSTGNQEAKQARKRENARRLGLRDWKDVLGAAALAGFPQTVVDSAARRCANLFGGSMELHTLNGDAPEGSQDKRVQYYPSMVPDPAAEDSAVDEDSEDDTQSQTARHIRASSAVSASSGLRGRSGSRSRSRSRASTRSRSRSGSVAGSHFCTVRGCERAAEGFTRRANLVRHMKLVHNMDGDELPVEVGSEDEMYGAVHVDGFLKPIKMRKGWRGDDVRRSESGPSKRVYAGRYSKRRGRNGSTTDTGNGDDDVVMGED